MRNYFNLDHYQTGYKQEIIGGLTTFMTMGYIIIVNPKILQDAGIPFGASVLATTLTVIFGTLLMGFYARRPFAIAPYMGENAFIAYTVCVPVASGGLGYSWEIALGAIFLSGIIFAILTLGRIRQWLVESIPMGLKYSFTAGIGLFLALIGLNKGGIIKAGNPSAPLQMGDLSDPGVLLTISGFIIIAFCIVRNIKGAILIGIIAVTIGGYFLDSYGIITIAATNTSNTMAELELDLSKTFMKLDLTFFSDISVLMSVFNVVLIIFIMAFIDTIGSLLGLSERGNFLDKDGNLPEIEKPMMVDALSNIFAPLVGTTTSGVYIESAAGIEAGGRSGLTSVVTAGLFLLVLILLLFVPSFVRFFIAIPHQAYSPALIIIGLFMMASVTKIDFKDYTESIPAFAVIALISFSYNIGVGITAGFILYPLFKLFAGKRDMVHPALWVLAALSLLFYVIYPYH